MVTPVSVGRLVMNTCGPLVPLRLCSTRGRHWRICQCAVVTRISHDEWLANEPACSAEIRRFRALEALHVIREWDLVVHGTISCRKQLL